MTKAKAALVIVIIVAVAFLLGLLIGYLQLRVANAELEKLRVENQLSSLRDRAAMVYLEASRQNYGLASEQAGLYFNQLQTLNEPTSVLPDDKRQTLGELLARRDEIVSALAKGEPTAVDRARALYLDTRERGAVATQP